MPVDLTDWLVAAYVLVGLLTAAYLFDWFHRPGQIEEASELITKDDHHIIDALGPRGFYAIYYCVVLVVSLTAGVVWPLTWADEAVRKMRG